MDKNQSNLESILEGLSQETTKSFLIELVNSLPNIVAILNQDRRLVYSNQALLDKISMPVDEIFEMRPGEIFKCVNVPKGDDGCGSSEECQLCGAFSALKVSMQKGVPVSNECRILSNTDSNTVAYNLNFTSIPFTAEGLKFYVITIEDISAEKRKKELEKIFYHDVINSMAGIQGVLRLMKNDENADPIKIEILESSYNSLNETINEQKDFALAEGGDLVPRKNDIKSLKILQNVELSYRENRIFDAKVVISEEAVNVEFVSDPIILNRIIVNMTKNALEASKEGDQVLLNVQLNDHSLDFSVHNPSFIPLETQYLIFERSFTTKGSGRGLGTFSMKLLGEKYLGGKVSFSSDKENGTIFYFKIPFEN